MITQTDRDLNKLNENFKLKVQDWLNANPDIFVTEAYRSQARQDYLYEQGRTRPGQIVTWTTKSSHTEGRAVDIAFHGELYPSDITKWEKIAESAKLFGIKWMFEEWGVDKPHFEDNGKPYKKTQELDLELIKDLNSDMWDKMESMQESLHQINEMIRQTQA